MRAEVRRSRVSTWWVATILDRRGWVERSTVHRTHADALAWALLEVEA